MSRKKWEQWYVKHIIKSPVLFLTFLFVGIVLFLSLSLSIKMEDGQSLLWHIFVEAGSSL